MHFSELFTFFKKCFHFWKSLALTNPPACFTTVCLYFKVTSTFQRDLHFTKIYVFFLKYCTFKSGLNFTNLLALFEAVFTFYTFQIHNSFFKSTRTLQKSIHFAKVFTLFKNTRTFQNFLHFSKRLAPFKATGTSWRSKIFALLKSTSTF